MMEKIKRVRAPVRIDFGGGTTDISPFRDKYGGCVLNACINRYVEGKIVKTGESVHLEYTGNTPTSSGLGTSGVMNLVWLSLISKIKDKYELAEKVYGLEQAMGLVGGKQDQYASAYGGINFMRFKGDRVEVERLKLKKDFVKEFEGKLVLVYTGEPHFSGTSNKLMIDNLKKGKNVENLIRIKKIAIEMRKVLLREDLDKFAELMNEETEERGRLHKSIIPLRVERMIEEGLRGGGVGAKVCGAGGGGSILFLGDKKRLMKKFRGRVIDFKFDFDGLKWL